jgi:hypothetical protein
MLCSIASTIVRLFMILLMAIILSAFPRMTTAVLNIFTASVLNIPLIYSYSQVELDTTRYKYLTLDIYNLIVVLINFPKGQTLFGFATFCLSVADKGYCKNVSCARNSISTILFHSYSGREKA